MAHDGAALCEPGFEDISAAEVRELLGVPVTQEQGMVHFPVSRVEELLALAYQAQSLRRVLLLLGTVSTDDCFGAAAEILGAADLSALIPPQAVVTAVCERSGTHPFTSADLARHAGAIAKKLLEQRGIPVTLSFHGADVQLFLSVHERSLAVGIDISGFDLSKREYKIFSHPAALKGTVAYALLRLAGYRREKTLLTCFSKSGMLEIEAALFAARRSPHFFRKDAFLCWKLPLFRGIDKDTFYGALDRQADDAKLSITGTHTELRHLMAGKKNAKIAAVHKLIRFSRVDLEWLDTTFSPAQIGTLLVYVTKQEAPQLPELFRHAAEIIAGGGTMLVASAAPLPEMGSAGLRLTHRRTVARGSGQLDIQIFTRV